MISGFSRRLNMDLYSRFHRLYIVYFFCSQLIVYSYAYSYIDSKHNRRNEIQI